MNEPNLTQIAKSIIAGLENLDEHGWQTVEKDCSYCKGKGLVYEWQDDMPGQEWCPSCGGSGIEYDNERFQAMKVELVLEHLRK